MRGRSGTTGDDRKSNESEQSRRGFRKFSRRDHEFPEVEASSLQLTGPQSRSACGYRAALAGSIMDVNGRLGFATVDPVQLNPYPGPSWPMGDRSAHVPIPIHPPLSHGRVPSLLSASAVQPVRDTACNFHSPSLL